MVGARYGRGASKPEYRLVRGRGSFKSASCMNLEELKTKATRTLGQGDLVTPWTVAYPVTIPSKWAKGTEAAEGE